MKKLLIVTIACLCFTANTLAQTGCSKYYPFKEGTKAEITVFDKKGEKSAIINYTILKTTKTSEGEVATMKSSVKDEKGKLIAETEYNATCDGNKISIDYKSMISPMMLDQFKDMEYDISGTDLEIPNNLSVGQTLPNAQMIMNISMGGINMNMEMQITNRKVVGKENVTTPAGTCDWCIITAEMTTKVGVSQTSKAKRWLAEGVGMVKQEEYQKGKVSSSSMLTAFTK